MRVYDIVSSNLTENAVSSGIKSWWSMGRLMRRLEPFIEASSEKYAQAVYDARKAGKIADPNPYAVLRNDLDPALNADQTKAVLDEIAKRSKSKIKRLEQESKVKPKTEPKPDEVKPDTIPSKSLSDYVLRRKFDDAVVDSLIVRSIGSAMRVLQFMEVYKEVKEYYKNKAVIDNDFKTGNLTKQMYEQYTRENREMLAAQLGTLVLAPKVIRGLWNGLPVVKHVSGISAGLVNMMTGNTNTSKVISVLSSEALGLALQQWLRTPDGQSAVRWAVQYAIDPSYKYAKQLGADIFNVKIDSLDAPAPAANTPAAEPAAAGQTTPASQPAQQRPNQSGQRAEPAQADDEPKSGFDWDALSKNLDRLQ